MVAMKMKTRSVAFPLICALLTLTPLSSAAGASIGTSEIIVEGAQASLPMPQSVQGGQLYVSVTRTTRGSGSLSVELTAERIGHCHLTELYPRIFVGSCPVLWTIEKEIHMLDFSTDTALTSAQLDTALRGKRLNLTWRGHGDMRLRPGGSDGYLLLQSRAAVTGGSWGKVEWELPEKPRKRDINEWGLYRRVESP